ncbi:MAG: DUF5658 family protein [Actinomycetota bacterium]|nr:DUF5658 family protein [Actinomycetota bacterium]
MPHEITVETRLPRPEPEPDLVIDLRDPPADRTRRSIALVVALNALNLLDALLTFALTEAGVAREGNPLIGWLTLPGKIVLVAALSFLLWRLRPRALIVPVVAYALVICYTLAGALWFA